MKTYQKIATGVAALATTVAGVFVMNPDRLKDKYLDELTQKASTLPVYCFPITLGTTPIGVVNAEISQNDNISLGYAHSRSALKLVNPNHTVMDMKTGGSLCYFNLDNDQDVAGRNISRLEKITFQEAQLRKQRKEETLTAKYR